MSGGYAELGALSNFTFLEGASHPHELVEQAKALGHAAIGIADRNSFAGLVRGHVAAAQGKLRFVPGARDTPAGSGRPRVSRLAHRPHDLRQPRTAALQGPDGSAQG